MLKISMFATECKSYYLRKKFIESRIIKLGYDKKFLFHKSYYTDEYTEMRICCKTHGFFKVLPKDLIKKKFVCPICEDKIRKANKKINLKLKRLRRNIRKKLISKMKVENPEEFKRRFINNIVTEEEYINKVNSIHNYKYDYSKSIYLGAKKPIVITCTLHGDFTKSRAENHYNSNSGCPKCK